MEMVLNTENARLFGTTNYFVAALGKSFCLFLCSFTKQIRDSGNYPDIFETPVLGINLHLIFRGADI